MVQEDVWKCSNWERKKNSFSINWSSFLHCISCLSITMHQYIPYKQHFFFFFQLNFRYTQCFTILILYLSIGWAASDCSIPWELLKAYLFNQHSISTIFRALLSANMKCLYTRTIMNCYILYLQNQWLWVFSQNITRSCFSKIKVSR